MNLFNYSILGLLLAVTFLAGCDSTKKSTDPTTEWVYTDPVQCLGNPWEKAWLTDDDTRDYNDYPRGKIDVIEEAEKRIIREYFETQNIQVHAITSRTFDKVFEEEQMICDACSCPQGYRLYLEIDSADLSNMQQRGYQVGAPE